MQDGKLLPAALAAKKRGVIFDVGHGGGSFDYTVAEAAIAHGAGPDTISSDIHVFSGNTPGMPYLTWVMSKFINMGFTPGAGGDHGHGNAGQGHRPAAQARHAAGRRAGRRVAARGGRRAGQFVDTRNNKREGKVHMKPAGAVVAGVAFGRPYQSPFAVR